MRTLKIREQTLAIVAAAEGIESRESANRRRYDRAAVNRCRRKRERLLSMRAVRKRYGLPWWLVQQFVADGLVPTQSGAKGSRLIDPFDLKPLLEIQICTVCDEPAPLGRDMHGDCRRRTPEARLRTSESISSWWQSPDAEEFRAKLVALPCPNCGEEFDLAESALRARQSRWEHVFCSKACGAEYRWRQGVGLENFVRRMPGRARQRWFGRWSGKLGGRKPVARIDPNYEQKAAEVLRLHNANPRLGGRALAERVGLSHRQVRQLLGRLGAS